MRYRPYLLVAAVLVLMVVALFAQAASRTTPTQYTPLSAPSSPTPTATATPSPTPTDTPSPTATPTRPPIRTPEPPPTACPITRPPDPPFTPPSPYPAKAPYGDFWYGTEALWTALRPEGTWWGLPYYNDGYVQKVFWWRKGYDGHTEPTPKLTVTGRRLDAPAPPFTVPRGTNASHPDFGGWAMLVGVHIPTLGCWEITGQYEGHELSFVVRIAR